MKYVKVDELNISEQDIFVGIDKHLYVTTTAGLHRSKEQITEVEEKPEKSTELINIYPNPASDRIYIDSKYLEGMTVSVTNILGIEQNIEATGNYIEIGNITSGIYFVNIKNANGRIAYNLKFVKCIK
jgi:hypothetical protein